MSDTVFREKQSISDKPANLGKGSTPDVQSVVEVEPLYTDYEETGNPYVVDYFDLGSYWQNKTGGFEEEVSLIEDYINDKIESGEIANSVKTVKNELKKMEKFINVTNDERPVLRIGILAAHIKFLNETKNIKENFGKYGTK